MKQDDWLPVSLFATGRVQCEDCGAPLRIEAGAAVMDCRYCGGKGVVERRLRTVEAVVEDGVETIIGPEGAKWTPWHAIEGVEEEGAQCPVCGAEVREGEGPAQGVYRCKHCGTASKLERRLRRGESVQVQAEEDGATAALVRRILDGGDVGERAELAKQLNQWCHINPTLARMLPEVMGVMKGADPRLEMPLGGALMKLLCEGDPKLRNAVLRAAEKVVFDVNGSKELLFALGLGSGVCLKLLLDAANYAADAGEIEYACAALWGCNLIFERHYEERDVCGEIVLYRLLYMRGAVQAWALLLAQGQMGLGYRYPLEVLLRFVDDCAVERPELLPAIEKCFYVGEAKDEAEWVSRLEFLMGLVTKEGKAAGLRHLGGPPTGIKEEAVGRVLRELVGMMGDEKLTDAVGVAMVKIIESGDELRPGVGEMVERWGDALPLEARYAYVERAGETPHLSKLPVRYWEPEREMVSEFGERLKEWGTMWREGILRAVDGRARRFQSSR